MNSNISEHCKNVNKAMHIRDTGRAIIAWVVGCLSRRTLPVFRCCYKKLLANSHFGLSIATAETIWRKTDNCIYAEIHLCAFIYLKQYLLSIHVTWNLFFTQFWESPLILTRARHCMSKVIVEFLTVTQVRGHTQTT